MTTLDELFKEMYGFTALLSVVPGPNVVRKMVPLKGWIKVRHDTFRGRAGRRSGVC